MNIRLKTYTGLTCPAVLCMAGALAGVFCLLQPCQAQQTLQQSVTFNDPLKQVNWISGPQKVSIGDLADINIPAGYRLTAAHGARLILDTLNNPVPDDVVGVLASDSGKWWAVIEYSPRGYVKNTDILQINPEKVLKQVEDQVQSQNRAKGASAVTTLNWASLPDYDPTAHSLDWSLQVETASATMLNETVVLFGRQGVLQITAVHSFTDSFSLKQIIAGNIAFKDGERYDDYQNGDKIAQVTLPELITGQKPANSTNESGGMVAAWIYSGLGVCLLVGGLAVMLKRKNSRNAAPAQAQAPVVAETAENKAAVAVANGADNFKALPALKNGDHQNGHARPEAVPAGGGGIKTLSRNRRKKIFDYSKFYTDVVRELSLHSCPGAHLPANGNGKARLNGYANGHKNGNGHSGSNGHANGTNGANGSGMNELLKAEIEKLIATQKNLIVEQKCLLEQQTKLIAEKRWFIEEQTAFLKNQSVIMNEYQYPLKFD